MAHNDVLFVSPLDPFIDTSHKKSDFCSLKKKFNQVLNCQIIPVHTIVNKQQLGSVQMIFQNGFIK